MKRGEGGGGGKIELTTLSHLKKLNAPLPTDSRVAIGEQAKTIF